MELELVAARSWRLAGRQLRGWGRQRGILGFVQALTSTAVLKGLGNEKESRQTRFHFLIAMHDWVFLIGRVVKNASFR
jgi:hypothetical protein